MTIVPRDLSRLIPLRTEIVCRKNEHSPVGLLGLPNETVQCVPGESEDSLRPDRALGDTMQAELNGFSNLEPLHHDEPIKTFGLAPGRFGAGLGSSSSFSDGGPAVASAPLLSARTCFASSPSWGESGAFLASARRTVPPGPPPLRMGPTSMSRSRAAAYVARSQPSSSKRRLLQPRNHLPGRGRGIRPEPAPVGRAQLLQRVRLLRGLRPANGPAKSTTFEDGSDFDESIARRVVRRPFPTSSSKRRLLPIEEPSSGTWERNSLESRRRSAALNCSRESGSSVASARRTVPLESPAARMVPTSMSRSGAPRRTSPVPNPAPPRDGCYQSRSHLPGRGRGIPWRTGAGRPLLNCSRESGSSVASARQTVPPGPPPLRMVPTSMSRSRAASYVARSQPSSSQRRLLPTEEPSSGTWERNSLESPAPVGRAQLLQRVRLLGGLRPRRTVPPSPPPLRMVPTSMSRSRTL